MLVFGGGGDSLANVFGGRVTVTRFEVGEEVGVHGKGSRNHPVRKFELIRNGGTVTETVLFFELRYAEEWPSLEKKNCRNGSLSLLVSGIDFFNE